MGSGDSCKCTHTAGIVSCGASSVESYKDSVDRPCSQYVIALSLHMEAAVGQ